MARVALSNVTKVYPGNIPAVTDFSLDIADGEFVVLVGPSGCGKSTTLRLIAGLEELTSGTITIGERIVNDVHPKDRDVAMVFQNYALYPHMTAYKNMAFALKLRKVPRAEIERRVREAAAVLGITDLLDRRPKALSGGQRQRVAVGRAIVRNPRCFLFDEPLSNLDVKLRVQMRAEIKSLHLRLKTTAVYVTHDQEEAMTLGDRVAVMSDGVIQQVAPPLEVYRRPANRFVAGFIGMPPMNFIDGRIERADDGLWFSDGGDVRMRVPERARSAAERHVDAPVVLGLRPESLSASAADGSPGGGLRLTVRLIEPLGDRIDIYGTTAGGADLIARVDAATRCEPGQQIALGLDPDAVHLFEPSEFGRSLSA